VSLVNQLNAGGGFFAPVFSYFIAYFLSIIQLTNAGFLQFCYMYEYIFTAFIRGDKAIAFICVKPFYCAVPVAILSFLSVCIIYSPLSLRHVQEFV